MSIQEFSSALRDKANTAARQQLSQMQDRLLQYSSKAYKSKNEMLNAASILQGDSEKFRATGERQGRTRLVLTKDSAAALIKSFVPGLDESTALSAYVTFIEEKYPKYAARHFEIYVEDGSGSASNVITKPTKKTIAQTIADIDKTKIAAFRGMNFSHANTLTHIVEFLRSLGAFTGKSAEEAKKEVTALFERGHIYAQTTGRQIVSIGDIQEDTNILDRIVKLSMDLDIASSSLSNKPIYAQLDAAIKKDFSSSKLYMNIEFQEKFSSTGIGNQDTGKITKGLQILSSLIKLLSTEYDKKNRLIGIPKVGLVTEAAKSFDNLVKKLDKYSEQMEKVLAGYMDNPAEYILDLKSSKNIKEYIRDQVVSVASTGKAIGKLNISHKDVKIYEHKAKAEKMPKLTELANAAKKISDTLKKAQTSKSNIKSIRAVADPQLNLFSLTSFINTHLQDVVAANMGDGKARDILNYQTGRFASSVKVERMSQSREGMITAFYSYMKNPYATFSEGGRQQYPKSRDPKLLISKSIREIAAEKVSNRLRAVVV